MLSSYYFFYMWQSIILSFIFGLIIGSFLNVVICRLPREETLHGRSRCPHCRRTLAWFELVPVLSFVVLTRKCRTCKTVISWQYPLVELATALLFALSVSLRLPELEPLTLSSILAVLRDWIVISALLVTFATDLTSQLIYDAVLFAAGVLAFLLGVFSGNPLPTTLLGGILGASFFGLQYLISKGIWIGAGDIVLGGFLGIVLGFPNVFVALALAYVLGLVVALPLLACNKKQWGSRIAFGTFLSVAGIITFFWGNKILDWYFNLILM